MKVAMPTPAMRTHQALSLSLRYCGYFRESSITVTPQAMQAAPPARASLRPQAMARPATVMATTAPTIFGRQPLPAKIIRLFVDDLELRHRAPVLGRIHSGVDCLFEVRLGGGLVLGDDLLHAG